MAITNTQEIGTYIHSDGRRVRMKSGTMGLATVYFYMRRCHVVIVPRDDLLKYWKQRFGNHILKGK